MWGVEDVLAKRPDLDAEQAWEVLRQVRDGHDANTGITWDTIDDVSQDIFPDPDPFTTVWARSMLPAEDQPEQRHPTPGDIAVDQADGPQSPEHAPDRGGGRGR